MHPITPNAPTIYIMETHDGLLARAWIIQLIHTRKAVRLTMRRALKNSGAGISFEMFQVLNSLWQEHGISQQTLAERIGKDKACLPNLMTQLEKRGYIYRKESTHDRRNKLVYLTPAGQKFQHQVMPAIYQVYQHIEASLSPDTISQSHANLKTLHEILENF